MLTININDGELIYKDIQKENLQDVLHLYNSTDGFMYATGMDKLMTLEDINQKYLEVLVNRHEFFAGIFTIEEDKLIGVLKGRIDYENMQEAWIMSLIIHSDYQKKGIGKKAVEKLIDYLYDNYDVKTVFTGIISGNNTGIGFWEKVGFNHVRTIEQYMRLNERLLDFVIMRREI